MLRQFLRTDYRGIVTLAADWRELREALGLTKVPHYSTLAYAAARLMAGAEKRGTFQRAQAALMERARAAGLVDPTPVAAVDATGLETRHMSATFGMRRAGTGHRQRAWPKLTAVVHVASHLIVGAVPGVGPSQGSPDFTPAMRQAATLMAFDTALADAGYDAEHNHRLCRDELGLRQTVIALNPRNAGRRSPSGVYRCALWNDFPVALYHQRWHAESAFSQHKRRFGSALTARAKTAQQQELALRVITHNLALLATTT